jgi:glycosyltransferase involved in cell wall biosynthesis
MSNLLVLGPLPPPLTGTPVSFDIFCEIAKKSPSVKNLTIVDSSPKFLKQQKKFEFSTSNIKQALSILINFTRNIGKADSTIIFGSNGYVVTMGPILLFIAKLRRKKCYFRAFGGSLDQYVENQSGPLKWLAKTTLKNFSGLIVETKLLKDHFSALFDNGKVHYVPGYRQQKESSESDKSTETHIKLRIVFVGIVKEDKGIFVLLNAMRKLSERNENVELTVYGSIHEPIRAQFEREVSELKNTIYGGTLDWREVIDTLSHQDALVLPTFYHSEGHPGVLIEAMMAGITIISTNFRSIPEIVTHEYNGLLVPPSDAHALSEAIVRLADDKNLLRQLRHNNTAMSQNFIADVLVQDILNIAGE